MGKTSETKFECDASGCVQTERTSGPAPKGWIHFQYRGDSTWACPPHADWFQNLFGPYHQDRCRTSWMASGTSIRYDCSLGLGHDDDHVTAGGVHFRVV